LHFLNINCSLPVKRCL